MRTTELENKNRLAGSREAGLKDSSPGPRPLAGFDLTTEVLCPHVLLAQHTPAEPSGLTQKITNHKAADFYGLYYAECDEKLQCPAFVISSDGKPIPPKSNDPDAPTHPGLHVSQRLFPFAWSQFSPQGFAFRTGRVGHTAYSFQGRFGRENVDVIPDVPYLVGVLTETHDGRVVSKKKVHFGHAVIL
jgi:hypothetical protein